MIEAAILGAAGAAAVYRAALAWANTGQPGTVRAKLAAVLGGGGPGVRA